MRIERISDTQMRFVLMSRDLVERDINISEMSHSSNKTQKLFKEIMKLAQEEGAFSPEHSQFMLEAKPAETDSLTITVTKLSAEELETRFSLTTGSKGHCCYKRKIGAEQPGPMSEDSQIVFSFEELDVAAAACAAVCAAFYGESQLYKFEGKFYLWLQNDADGDISTTDMRAILAEFGSKHATCGLGREFLAEHGDVVIAADAVGKLSGYHAG